MPIYEYQCKNCNHIEEALQKISDPPLIHCPKCERDGLEKIVSQSRFKLTGTGWYETDFKPSSSKPENKDTSSSEKPASKEKTSGTTSETQD